jgi:sensor histidine kinase YesM
MKKEESKILKEIQTMLYAQRWCHENNIEHYTRELVRLFVVIRNNNKIYELELSQTEIELRAKEYKNTYEN